MRCGEASRSGCLVSVWSEVERWIAAYLGEPAESFDDGVLTAINASLELRRHGRRVHPSRQTMLRDLAGL